MTPSNDRPMSRVSSDLQYQIPRSESQIQFSSIISPVHATIIPYQTSRNTATHDRLTIKEQMLNHESDFSHRVNNYTRSTNPVSSERNDQSKLDEEKEIWGRYHMYLKDKYKLQASLTGKNLQLNF